MADCDKEFKKFYEKIKLDVSKGNSLRQSREAVRDRIRASFKDDLNVEAPKFRGQGSYAMSTIVNPLNGEYDIDDGVYLENLDEDKANWPTTQTVHSWVVKAVDGQTSEPPSDKNKCVRVRYAGNYHVDLPIYGMNEGNSLLAVKDQGWVESDPKALNDWFIDAVQAQGDQLKRNVRYLKAWADNKSSSLSLPSGLVITVLVVENFVSSTSDSASFVETIRKISDLLVLSSEIYNPVDPLESLSEGISENKINNLKDGLLALLSCADEVEVDDACKHWRSQFGDRFPSESLKKREERLGAPIIVTGGQRPHGFIGFSTLV